MHLLSGPNTRAAFHIINSFSCNVTGCVVADQAIERLYSGQHVTASAMALGALLLLTTSLRSAPALANIMHEPQAIRPYILAREPPTFAHCGLGHT